MDQFWKGCKPSFVCPADSEFKKRSSRFQNPESAGERIICLSSQYPRLSTFRSWNRRFRRLLFGLAPDGVFRASKITLGAVGSYSTFSPLPAHRSAEAVYFLWHFPSTPPIPTSKPCQTFEAGIGGAARAYPAFNGRLRGIAPCGVRTFLLELAPEAILHPSKTEPEKYDSLRILARQMLRRRAG